MNSEHHQPEVPSLDEDLVAYLDGELDDSASRRLEERLANDDSARARLRSLATSWDLLDHLPRAALDDNFTRTTVELVALEARNDIDAERAAIPARNRRRWIAGAAAALACAMVGFAAVVVAWPDANERLLRDLPVVQNLELYEIAPHTGAIDFLKDLEKDELFIGDAAQGTSAGSVTASIGSTSEGIAERRAEVEALAPEKKAELRKLYVRFEELSEEEKDRLRALDRALRAEPEETRLLAVLESYHNWLATLSPLDRDKLTKMSADDAMKRIKGLMKDQLHNAARFGRSRQGPLTQDDVDVIERWLQEWAGKHNQVILENASADQREWFNDKVPNDRKSRALVSLAISFQPGRQPKINPPLTEMEWNDLLDRLPPVKALFASQGKGADSLKLANDVKTRIKEEVGKAATTESKQKLLLDWYLGGLRARDAVGGGVSLKELNRFFEEELTDKEREELALAAPEEAHRRLRFLYLVKKELPPGHWRGPWKGDRGRGPGRRGDGGDRGGFDRGRREGSPRFDRGPDDHPGGRGERSPDDKRPRPSFDDDGAPPPRPPDEDRRGGPDAEERAPGTAYSERSRADNSSSVEK